MKHLKFLFIGLVFGIIMYKSQAISWFRIYEMFRFEAFHMFGIIGSALLLGMGMIQLIKYKKLKNIYGEHIQFTPKEKGVIRYLFGGGIFGLGWALAGSCPGPIYVLIGSGAWSILIVLFSALIGTILYGVLRKKLPH